MNDLTLSESSRPSLSLSRMSGMFGVVAVWWLASAASPTTQGTAMACDGFGGAKLGGYGAAPIAAGWGFPNAGGMGYASPAIHGAKQQLAIQAAARRAQRYPLKLAKAAQQRATILAQRSARRDARIAALEQQLQRSSLVAAATVPAAGGTMSDALVTLPQQDQRQDQQDTLREERREEQTEGQTEGQLPSPLLANTRWWTDRSGQHRVLATLVRVDTQTVALQRADGPSVQVAIQQLSPADQSFVAQARIREAAAAWLAAR